MRLIGGSARTVGKASRWAGRLRSSPGLRSPPIRPWHRPALQPHMLQYLMFSLAPVFWAAALAGRGEGSLMHRCLPLLPHGDILAAVGVRV
eukprot:13478607-Alexandrium_andersonii.AAC.1